MPLSIDFHCHSIYSDGELSPEAVVLAAKQQGVDVLALTDHDTIAGLTAAGLAAKQYGVTLINGIEFSAACQLGGIHIIGLGFDADHAGLNELIAKAQAIREQRAMAVSARLDELGIAKSYATIRDKYASDQIGRPHFAKFLLDNAHVNNFRAAFRHYLGKNKVAYVETQWLAMQEVISEIQAAGGVAILAHPCRYQLTNAKLKHLLSAFKQAGGDAVEVVTATQTAEESHQLAHLAAKNGLAASVGSDFHGPSMPWVQFGKLGALPESCNAIWSQLPLSQLINEGDHSNDATFLDTSR